MTETDAEGLRSLAIPFREAGPRDKVSAFIVGVFVIVASIYVGHLWHTWAINPVDPETAASAATPHIGPAGLVGVGRLQFVWWCGTGIVVTAILTATGWSGIQRRLGLALHQVGIWFRVESDQFGAFAIRLASATTPRTSRVTIASIGVLIPATWLLLFNAVHLTGGLQSSPYVQFAASMFIWELILADRLLTRTFIACIALVFIILLALIHTPHDDPVGAQFSVGYVFFITVVNLVFQFIPLIFARERRRQATSSVI